MSHIHLTFKDKGVIYTWTYFQLDLKSLQGIFFKAVGAVLIPEWWSVKYLNSMKPRNLEREASRNTAVLTL